MTLEEFKKIDNTDYLVKAIKLAITDDNLEIISNYYNHDIADDKLLSVLKEATLAGSEQCVYYIFDHIKNKKEIGNLYILEDISNEKILNFYIDNDSLWNNKEDSHYYHALKSLFKKTPTDFDKIDLYAKYQEYFDFKHWNIQTIISVNSDIELIKWYMENISNDDEFKLKVMMRPDNFQNPELVIYMLNNGFKDEEAIRNNKPEYSESYFKIKEGYYLQKSLLENLATKPNIKKTKL